MATLTEHFYSYVLPSVSESESRSCENVMSARGAKLERTSEARQCPVRFVVWKDTRTALEGRQWTKLPSLSRSYRGSLAL
jgi:predicted ATPase with chaperone activity